MAASRLFAFDFDDTIVSTGFFFEGGMVLA
jgi:hypothetical protein